MKILLLGPGAVGVYFCGRLAGAGHEVSVVARSDYDVATRSGYQIRSFTGDFEFHPARVLRDPADDPVEADFIFVTTKLLPGVDRTGMLKRCVKSPRSVIVLIQNGIGIEDEIAAEFPQNELLSVIAYIGVSRPEPGVVRHTGKGNLHIGRFPAGDSVAARRLTEAFESAGVQAEYHEDIQPVRWQKLLWNLPFNPVSVLAGGADTQALTEGMLVKLCSALMDETIEVARAAGIALTRAMADHQIDYTRKFPPYKSSMLQDYEAGRHLEVEAILGNVVRLAEKYHIPVPHMESCYALLESVDRKIR